MKKRIMLSAVMLTLIAGLGLAQDSSGIRTPDSLRVVPVPPPPAVPAAPPELSPPAIPFPVFAPPPAGKPGPRPKIFGAGFRISVLDKSSLFLSLRPCPWLNLELGGFGSRKHNESQYTYNYRYQAAADYLLMTNRQVRPFVGLRLSYERYRQEYQNEWLVYDSYYYGGGDNFETGTKRRIGLSVGADIDAGRIGLQFGLTPLYDESAKTTRHYRVYEYFEYAGRDTAVTTTSSETAMEYSNFFVAVRVLF